uniref:Uncharacterized protein n=1 Tax=Arundo donax TaxID=35708 RepID=A0A0A8Z809_ARUDO
MCPEWSIPKTKEQTCGQLLFLHTCTLA